MAPTRANHYTVDSTSGRLSPARQLVSPNQDARPGDARPELIVLHGISLPPGEFGGPAIEQLFMNRLDCDAHPYYGGIRGMRVSAHLLIRRDGGVLQFVPFGARAWHAGSSRFRGRSRCNDFSIGIELEGSDDRPYADRQYEELVPIIRSIRAAYPAITSRHLAGHCDVSPGRKSDPGPAFDWLRLYDALAA
ncbi:MAG: 1,6-anhydro-N-acetylmuramyl-L-alanine amidase AmpD [Woeseiaceae bacterium]